MASIAFLQHFFIQSGAILPVNCPELDQDTSHYVEHAVPTRYMSPRLQGRGKFIGRKSHLCRAAKEEMSAQETLILKEKMKITLFIELQKLKKKKKKVKLSP
jgi:hypothetical protein